MNNTSYKVSVGTPAYNEEANIKHLILALLSQTQTNFALHEILVVSDGSSDNTVSLVRSIEDDRVRVIAHEDRKGQAMRQNEILEMFSGDALVLLNADILPTDDTFLEKFIAPLRASPKVGLVGCHGATLAPLTFVERVLNFSVAMKDYMFGQIDSGNNIYTCHGHSRAFSKSFAKQMSWPAVMAEDSYSYLVCKQLGFEYAYAPRASIYFREPQTLKDHLKQSVRFEHSKEELESIFSPRVIQHEFAIPKSVFLNSTLKYFIHHPILFTAYIVMQLYAKINPYKQQSTAIWEPSMSSKVLKN